MSARILTLAGVSVRQFLLMSVCLIGLMSAPAAMDTAVACPMCQVANENADDSRPRAYMYSILFMLAMPATVLAGFGIGFYRLSKTSSTRDGGTHHLEAS